MSKNCVMNSEIFMYSGESGACSLLPASGAI